MIARRCAAGLVLAALAVPAHAETAPEAGTEVGGEVVIVTTAVQASAEAAAPAAEPGFKQRLAQSGFNLSASATAITQGQIEGDGIEGWDAFGRADVLLDVDFDKLGLNTGTMLRTHGEIRFASPRGNFGGQLLPGSVAALSPLGPQEQFELSSIHFVQKLGPKTALMLGKISALDLLAGDPFFGGAGTQRFVGLPFAAPPSGVVPLVIYGGVLSHKAGDVSITAMAFDPEDRTTKYGFGGLFKTGVNLSLGATWSGTMGGRATSFGVTGTYSTKTGQDLGDILIPGAIGTSLEQGSYNLAVQGSHIIVPSESREGKGLGVYFKAAIADGNPNIIQASFVGGIAGHAVVRGRPDDSFGIGIFYYNFSNVLQDAADPLLDFQDEKGIEAYYSFAITPSIKISPDIQIIDPARGNFSTAIIGALRLHVSI